MWSVILFPHPRSVKTCPYSASDWLWPWYCFSVNAVPIRSQRLGLGPFKAFFYWSVTAILSINLSLILRFVSCHTCRKKRAHFAAGRDVCSVTNYKAGLSVSAICDNIVHYLDGRSSHSADVSGPKSEKCSVEFGHATRSIYKKYTLNRKLANTGSWRHTVWTVGNVVFYVRNIQQSSGKQKQWGVKKDNEM